MTDFIPINIAVLTISDSRTLETDTSGAYLADAIKSAGHKVADRKLSPDNIYEIRALVSQWIASPHVNVVITTGGTGLTGRDSTPEAVAPLFDKAIEGFGEMFRALSYEEIGTSTIASRCVAGVANGTFLFCLPGSTGACRTGWESLISKQLDSRTGPCNLVSLMPRLKES